jgi:hypothetical protein
MAAEPDERLTLPVPDSVGAFYAVPTTDTSVDAAGLVAAALGQVEDSLPRPLPQPLLQAHRVDELPPLPLEQMAAAGATEAQLARAQAATHLILVTVGGRPGWPPAHEWLARTMAATAAWRHGTDVVDLHANRVLDLATIRSSLPDADGLVCLADWVSVGYWPDRAGYSCSTTGLRRFGLPEMQTLATPPNLVDAWGRAMIGLAGQLLAAWRDALAAAPDAAFVQLRPSLALTGGDVVEAHTHSIGRFGPYASASGAGSAASVRLALDPGPDPQRHNWFLTVHPPVSWAGSAGEHLADACRVLLGPSPNEIRHATSSLLMERAIATARAGLTDIRLRFESGALELRQKLLVKYALPTDLGTEYVWAYVTSWRDPFRILATSAADAVYDPRVRAGRPVVVDTASVVDWAVEDDDGIVEGAWTQAALDESH